jgi:hypothetical protein
MFLPMAAANPISAEPSRVFFRNAISPAFMFSPAGLKLLIGFT